MSLLSDISNRIKSKRQENDINFFEELLTNEINEEYELKESWQKRSKNYAKKMNQLLSFARKNNNENIYYFIKSTISLYGKIKECNNKSMWGFSSYHVELFMPSSVRKRIDDMYNDLIKDIASQLKELNN